MEMSKGSQIYRAESEDTDFRVLDVSEVISVVEINQDK